jgi:hypothetical protein
MGARTAAEVMADLERRKREDPAYRAELERVERERAERDRQLRIAEQPVIDDLKDIGLEVDDLWDLYKIPDSRPKAIPVLLKHLALDYPDRVLEGIGQGGLYDPSARTHWAELRRMLLNTDREAVRDRVAAALSKCARREHYDDLIDFVRDERLGESRIYFLRPINRIGNRMLAGQGRAVIEGMSDDPVLGREATAILQGRSRSQ